MKRRFNGQPALTVGAVVLVLAAGLAFQISFQNAAVEACGSGYGYGYGYAPAAPDAPVSVTAIGGDADVVVRWHPPADIGSGPIEAYEIEATPDGGSPLPTMTVDGAVLETTFAGLANDTDYTFRVRACNAGGFGPYSAPSNLARTRADCTLAPFPDVSIDNSFCAEITWMVDNHVSRGYDDGTYRPAVSVSRQAMAAFLYRLLNPGDIPAACTTAPFTDVGVDHPFCAEIQWMSDAGITTGFDDGTYRGNDAVSRQAMAAFLYRANGEPDGAGPVCTTDPFSDVVVGQDFCGEIDWLKGTGITGGYDDGTYRPTTPVTRQAIAAFIYRNNITAGFIV